jgi:hypothetical protein
MTAWWPVPIAHHESALPLIIDPWTGKQAGNTWQCGWRRAKTWLAGQHWLAEGDSSSVAAGHLVPGAAVECPASCFGVSPPTCLKKNAMSCLAARSRRSRTQFRSSVRWPGPFPGLINDLVRRWIVGDHCLTTSGIGSLAGYSSQGRPSSSRPPPTLGVTPPTLLEEQRHSRIATAVPGIAYQSNSSGDSAAHSPRPHDRPLDPCRIQGRPPGRQRLQR